MKPFSNKSFISGNGEFIRPTSTLKWVAVLVFSTQVVITLMFFRRGIYADQFDFLPLLKSMSEGGNWLASVLLPHGDHWHTGAYILMLPMAHLSNWSLLPEALLNLLISLTGWLFLQSLIKSILDDSRQLAIVFPVLSVIVYFSLSNTANLLWTWQMSTHLTISGLMVMIYGLTKIPEKPYYFLLAITGAMIGTVSFATGFVLWPVGLVVLAIYPNLKTRKRLLLGTIWLVIATTIVGTFVLIKNSTFSAGVVFDPIVNVKFLIVYLGASLAIFSRDLGNALGLGGLVLFFILFVVIARRRDGGNSKALVLATALALFSILAGVLISIGRIKWGLDQARGSRYMIFANVFWMAISILLYRYFVTGSSRGICKTICRNSIIGAFVIMLFLSTFTGQRIARGEIRLANSYNKALVDYVRGETKSTQFFLYPNEEQLNRYLDYLKIRRLNAFR